MISWLRILISCNIMARCKISLKTRDNVGWLDEKGERGVHILGFWVSTFIVYVLRFLNYRTIESYYVLNTTYNI